MTARCYQPKCKEFRLYGARGITVCERWKGYHGFENFCADMGERPSGTSLDRIDNDGQYSPENCRWATQRQQARNSRKNRLLTLGDRTACIAEWAEITGISQYTIRQRVAKLGWSDERALTEGVRPCI
jgi:hypothetical protein